MLVGIKQCCENHTHLLNALHCYTITNKHIFPCLIKEGCFIIITTLLSLQLFILDIPITISFIYMLCMKICLIPRMGYTKVSVYIYMLVKSQKGLKLQCVSPNNNVLEPLNQTTHSSITSVSSFFSNSCLLFVY